MIRRPPRSTLDRSSAASDVYKRQDSGSAFWHDDTLEVVLDGLDDDLLGADDHKLEILSLIHISEPTRPY